MIISIFIIPVLLILALILALVKKKDAYSAFCDGAKEGLLLCKDVIPSILAMISAVTILKCSGLIEDISTYLAKLFTNGDYFAHITPMVFFRPISGGASLAILKELCSTDPDSLECITASLIQGSTDTTFYVIALYFSTVKVTKWRHTLPAALFADFIGIALAILFALVIFS